MSVSSIHCFLCFKAIFLEYHIISAKLFGRDPCNILFIQGLIFCWEFFSFSILKADFPPSSFALLSYPPLIFLNPKFFPAYFGKIFTPDVISGHFVAAKGVQQYVTIVNPIFLFLQSMAHHGWNQDCKVYVGGLREETNKYDLEDAFSKIGRVRSFHVFRLCLAVSVSFSLLKRVRTKKYDQFWQGMVLLSISYLLIFCSLAL